MPADHLTTPWSQVGLRFHDWAASERVMSTEVAPRLDEIAGNRAPGGWWFLRKHPEWRVRIYDADPAAVHALLDKAQVDGIIAGWQPGTYEAEAHAFGGPLGMDIAHDLFCADSHGVLNYARMDSPPIGRRELSLLLISATLAAARLDWFERGDVLARVAGMRPIPPADNQARLAELAGQLRPLLAIAAEAAAYRGSPVAFASEWLSAFTEAGRRYADVAADRALTRGLRAILPHAVIFHWNRLGLSAPTQGMLATAARDAYLPPS